MIACPICQHVNHHLAIACTSCGSYLQPKVETLDLFATVWQLVETPKRAFHRIALATHKNYMLFLSAVTGIGFGFALLWILKVGNMNIPFANMLIAGLVLGPLVGVVALLLSGALQKLVARAFRLESTFKNSLAVIAYAYVPIAFAVIFILPIEISIFGKYFFSTNPSPLTLKPLSYILLLGLNGVCFLWSLMLYGRGVGILYNISLRRALLISNITVALLAAVVFLAVAGVNLLRVETHVERLLTHSYDAGI